MDIPVLYLVSGKASPAELDCVTQALAITPIAGVIVTSVNHQVKARRLSDNIILDSDDLTDLITRYLSIAIELMTPVAIVADCDDVLTAVFADAHKETINAYKA